MTCEIHDVHGYNPAGVYVRRISGKTESISVAEIIISAVGDGYAQEELDAENAEAERYPLGVKEFWRSRLVGKATYGKDGHPMTDEEFESSLKDRSSSRVRRRLRWQLASSAASDIAFRPS